MCTILARQWRRSSGLRPGRSTGRSLDTKEACVQSATHSAKETGELVDNF
jgi:hypothetical protein